MSQSLSSTDYHSHHYSGLQPKINLPYGQLRVFSSLSSTGSTQPYKPILISAFPSASVNQSSSLSTLPFASSGLGFVGNDWIHKLRDAWQSEVGTVPDSFYLTSSILAFLILPRFLRICYKFTVHDPSVLSTSLFRLQVPYENSLWKALEDPLRCLVIFIALTKNGTMVTSTTIAHTHAQTWRVAFMFSVIWFLQRWKTSLFLFACESFGKHDQAKIVTLDRVASGCLCVVGLMGSALACGVAVYPISIVGGIWLVNTVLKAFSLGDTVKVGSVEGRVVEMGLVTTWLLNDKEIPVMIPNSMFASQVCASFLPLFIFATRHALHIIFPTCILFYQKPGFE
ncbi:hypothetical protein Q3G72_032366 [Acer saccharum]|nr:hypothetical protein Q3G72_032366 [Acer saccharum]